MKSIEEDIKRALCELVVEKRAQAQERCPPEEIFALYMNGDLAEDQKEGVTEHLSFCPDCLDIVALEAVTEKEHEAADTGIPVPSRVVDRAKNLVKSGAQEALFDIVVRLYRGSLEILHSSLQPLPPIAQPAFASLRGAEEEQSLEPVRMEKVFKGISAEIRLEISQEDLLTIQVFLKKKEGGTLPQGLRVTLKDLPLEKELRSVPVQDGVAVFWGLAGGEYEVEIRELGHIIGTTSLCLS